MDAEIIVSMARHDDREFIVEAFRLMLEDGSSAGMFIPMAATDENANLFYSMVIEPAIDAGDPILIASDGGSHVGLLVWSEYRGPLVLCRRTAYGYGCWVRASHRRRRISRALRLEGIRILRERGVQCVEGSIDIHNDAGIKSAQRHGFTAHSAIVRLAL